jgi:cystathionine beta-lyase/cystathionine gamma-synthase
MTVDPSHPRAAAGNESIWEFATRAVFDEAGTASAFPIYQATAVDGHYIRAANPSVQAFEEKVAYLEGGTSCVATSSGMSAITQCLLGLLQAGDRIVAHKELFVGVQTFFDDFLTRLGIEVTQVDFRDSARLDEALSRPTRAVYFEPVVNPTLEVINPTHAIAAAARVDAYSILDNTMLTPYLYRPLTAGADVVIHSSTKYLAGHGDALGGVVSFRDAGLAAAVHKSRRILGGMPSPFNVFLTMRGLKSLAVRMERHCESAATVAARLAQHPSVEGIRYPGLAGSRNHAVASSFLAKFGGLISLVPSDRFNWSRFCAALTLCRSRMSFGDASTLVQFHAGQVRISVGLEDPKDIVGDLEQALRAAVGT